MALSRHRGQRDSGGLYFDHLERVAERVAAAGGGRAAQAAAYLHGLRPHLRLSWAEIDGAGVDRPVVSVLRTLDRWQWEIEHPDYAPGAAAVRRACAEDRLEHGELDDFGQRVRRRWLAELDRSAIVRAGDATLDGLAAMTGADWWYAVEAVASLRTPRAAEVVIGWLEAGTPVGAWTREDAERRDRRSKALTSLRCIMTGAEWIPSLRELARHPHADIRAVALELLLRGSATDAEVIELIDDPDREVSFQATLAAGRRRLHAALEPLTRGLRSENLKAAATVRALGMIGDPAVVRLLESRLCGESPMVAYESAHALVRLACPEAEAAALRVLTGPEPAYRRNWAAWTLGEYRSRDAVPALIEAVPDTATQLGAAAIEALGKIGAAEAIPVLVDAARGPRGVHSRRMAIWAIGRIGPHLAPDTCLALADDPDPDLRKEAVPLLGQIPGDRATAALIAACRERNPRAAVRALVDRPDPRAIPTLVDLVRETRDRRVRSLALQALAAIGRTEDGHARAIRQRFFGRFERDPRVRRGQAWLEGRMAANDAEEQLTRMLDDPHPRVRAAAEAALGRRPR